MESRIDNLRQSQAEKEFADGPPLCFWPPSKFRMVVEIPAWGGGEAALIKAREAAKAASERRVTREVFILQIGCTVGYLKTLLLGLDL